MKRTSSSVSNDYGEVGFQLFAAHKTGQHQDLLTRRRIRPAHDLLFPECLGKDISQLALDLSTFQHGAHRSHFSALCAFNPVVRGLACAKLPCVQTVVVGLSWVRSMLAQGSWGSLRRGRACPSGWRISRRLSQTPRVARSLCNFITHLRDQSSARKQRFRAVTSLSHRLVFPITLRFAQCGVPSRVALLPPPYWPSGPYYVSQEERSSAMVCFQQCDCK